MAKGKGWRSANQPLSTATIHHLFGGAQSSPDAFSLTPYITTIPDQGDTSSCVGQAFAQAVSISAAVKGAAIPFPSAQGIYTIARVLTRPSINDPLQDDGTDPLQALRGLQNFGCPSSQDWPFDATKINVEPTLQEMSLASCFQLQGTYAIDSHDQDRVLDLCMALSKGYPVVFASGVIDLEFEEYVPQDGPINWTDPSQNLGGHMMCFVGYRKSSQGVIFTLANSWGPSWGVQGTAEVTENFVKQESTQDLIVITGVAIP